VGQLPFGLSAFGINVALVAPYLCN
jgi:hypothetical protein